MSELTPCNHCSLKGIRARVKAAGKKKVTVLQDAIWGMGGHNVYVHSKDVDISKLKGGEEGERRKYFVAWFMEIGERCGC